MSPNLKEAPDDFVTAYVGLGANLGDAQATLRAALSQMDRLAHTRLVSCSSFYRTEPIDSFGDDYINAVACLTTKLSPADRAFVLVPLFEIAPAGFASLDLLPDVLLPGVSGQRITCVTKALFLSPTERGGS